MAVEDPHKDSGVVAFVAQKGWIYIFLYFSLSYHIHDRILRAAKVGIVKEKEEEDKDMKISEK